MMGMCCLGAYHACLVHSMQAHKGLCARKGPPYLLHLCERCIQMEHKESHACLLACHALMSTLCIQYVKLYNVIHRLLTLLTANSTPLKYTMVMVPLPPFPMLLSTASREGRGRKDPSSKAAIFCVGGSVDETSTPVNNSDSPHQYRRQPCTQIAT